MLFTIDNAGHWVRNTFFNCKIGDNLQSKALFQTLNDPRSSTAGFAIADYPL